MGQKFEDSLMKLAPMNSLTVATLSQQHVDDAIDVLTRSFLHLNTIWKDYKPKYEEVFPIIRGKVLPAVNSRWSFVLLENKKVIGVSLQYDFLEYLQVPSMPTDLQLFEKLNKAGKQLEKQLDLSSLKKGEAMYGLYGVIDPDYANKGYSLTFWWQCFALGKVIGGWKYYYSRVSNPLSLKMLQKLGAEVLAETTVSTDLGQNKLWMIRIDMSNPFPTLTMLNQLAKKKSKKMKPSL